MNKEYEAAYRAALEADNNFQKELERVYGANAGDARYQMKFEDLAVVEAKNKFLEAVENLRLAKGVI